LIACNQYIMITPSLKSPFQHHALQPGSGAALPCTRPVL
jgi:hypothetical protein